MLCILQLKETLPAVWPIDKSTLGLYALVKLNHIKGRLSSCTTRL